MTNQINIEGQTYNVIGQTEFTHKGQTRTELHLQKPKGRRIYRVVAYENGTMSSVV